MNSFNPRDFLEPLTFWATVGGIALTLRLVWLAISDLRSLRRAGLNGDLLITARGNVRRYALKGAVQVFFLLCAIALIIAPNTPRTPLSWVGDLVVTSLLAATVILAYSGFADYRDDRKIARNGETYTIPDPTP